VKTTMGLRRLLQRMPRLARKKPHRPIPSGDNRAPKNGRLTLAVAASIIIMIVLGLLNVKLIRDRSMTGKAFGPSIPSQPEPLPSAATALVPYACNKSEGDAPPEVTFYRQLTVQDEKGPAKENATQELNSETESSPAQADPKTAETSKGPAKPVGHDRKQPRAGFDKPAGAPTPLYALPKAGSGAKIYTVQVGAFAHPSIAQQWATKWKLRGYEVSLKPVARPKSGVIYRLYLGNFSSEKKADELVKHLKANEGISALRLVLHN
jgi:cell division septation protein DedD